jgi:hypothetical protein
MFAVALVVSAAGCGGGRSGGPPVRVFLPSIAFERRYVEPPRYEFADGSLVAVNLSWEGWGSETATGRGRLVERDWSRAKPSELPTDTGIVLARGLEECRGEALYTELFVMPRTAAVDVDEAATKLPTPCHSRAEIDAEAGEGPAEASPSDREKTIKPYLFSMPSHNISCALWRDHVRCDIVRRRWTPPPRPEGCRLDWGSTISLPAEGGPAILCEGDPLLQADYIELPYGEIITRGAVSCLSRRDGLFCVNEEKRGFFLSLQKLTPF